MKVTAPRRPVEHECNYFVHWVKAILHAPGSSGQTRRHALRSRRQPHRYPLRQALPCSNGVRSNASSSDNDMDGGDVLDVPRVRSTVT